MSGAQAEEVGAGSARCYALEREKRQLEESLKNVLVINDQLLQKVRLIDWCAERWARDSDCFWFVCVCVCVCVCVWCLRVV